MLADNLTCIDLILRLDEETAAVLQMVDGIGVGITALQGNEGAVYASVYVALIRLVFLEAMGDDGLALTGREHVCAQANNAARRDEELDVDALSLTLHACHFALAARHHINHLRRKLFGHVNRHLLDGLALHAIYFLIYDLRLTDLQFVTLATHGFDENGQMQDAPTRHNPTVCKAFGNLYTQGKVLLEFTFQTFSDVTTRAILAFLAEEG